MTARVLIAASGTGGHLFPALHIARALVRVDPSCAVAFVGSGRPLEERILGPAGFPVRVLPVKGIKSRGLRGVGEFVLGAGRAVSVTRALLREFRPTVIVGVGGYVTFWPIVLGRLSGVPTWIHEAELRPGVANRVLSFVATRVSTAFRETAMPTCSNVVYTGHPVREGLDRLGSFLPLDRDPFRLFVMGGSQGAEGIDRAMELVAPFLRERGVEVIHQCRSDNVDRVQEYYLREGVQAKVVSFIDDMTTVYEWADVIVSRSGAGSTMELSVVNKPTIFVPFPHAQGDHQAANAMTLVSSGKALMEREGDGFPARLETALRTLFDRQRYNEMKIRPYEARSKDAAQRIATELLAFS